MKLLRARISRSLHMHLVAARARGMTDIAREAGVSREDLYRSLNGATKPEFDTIMRVLSALGVQLAAKPKAA